MSVAFGFQSAKISVLEVEIEWPQMAQMNTEVYLCIFCAICGFSLAVNKRLQTTITGSN